VERVNNVLTGPSPWQFLPRSLRGRHWSAPGSQFLFLFVSVITIALVSAGYSSAQVHPTESQVKAAYLYNFGKFVRWQDQSPSTASIQICVLGKDPFGTVLDSTVAGESIEGRKIIVKRVVKVQDAATCNILYISSSEESRLGFILSSVQHFAPLTVSDIPNFVERGGMIEFVQQQGKIRFEVNLLAAERSHVSLSSELLKVAVKVVDQAAP
jgi:hypothetical protein